jgi:1,2-dihydroxy-3-keto-5-methylthiopentene dioxygenase
MKAWFYSNTDATPQAPNQYSPSKEVSLEQLQSIGVFYQFFDVESPTFTADVDTLCLAKDYKNRDQITISREKLPNYDEKLKMFFTEHIHDDEEIRLIIEGSGYFDVRDANDDWVRISMEKGDLVILPAGIYHRFILDDKNFITAMRLFKEDPKWTPINRGDEAEMNMNRIQYMSTIVRSAVML